MSSKFAAAFASTFLCAAPALATFPGANGRIAFVRDDDIWTMNLDGSDQVDITNTASAFENSPVWSADGTQIAYSRAEEFQTFGLPLSGIWVMRADGSGQREVLPPPDDTSVCGPNAIFYASNLGGPAWSPDGSKLAFHNYRLCWFDTEFYDYDLNTVNPDGTGKTLVKQGGSDPRWSPDGTKIGYTAVCGGGGCTNVRWITPDGSEDFQVYTTSIDAETFIDWSPDGSLMDGCGEGAFGHPLFYCFTVHPDGTGYTEFPADASAGKWSPDGTKFLYGGVYTANSDGTDLTKIASGGAADWQPIPAGPRRSDYKNAAGFCKADRQFLGDASFIQKYGGGANAYGKCVSTK
jgi:Tol biopolymer transport system component